MPTQQSTRFRPCIDLHRGKVKQIVGGTLRDDGEGLRTNFESDRPARYFADLYCRDDLRGGHVIMLGPGNEAEARDALAAWPGGLQVGGGINAANAQDWIEAGASHVIVTSWLFSPEGDFLPERLKELVGKVGRERLVIDLSCRGTPTGWAVTMNRWQLSTNLTVTAATLDDLASSCAEFLVHAVDREGRAAGMDDALIGLLGGWAKLPITYAGGAASLSDLARCHQLTGGTVDLTIGSALDIFGGTGVTYADCLAWNRRLAQGR